MPSPNDLEKLFAQREEIDRALLENHSRDVTLMFTDIVGSTQYFEKKGDIEGLRLVRRHNELLFPVVARHHGRVVKTIGDAIMAVFETPADGVRCAAEMQRTLERENGPRRTAGEEPIHIRIGLHGGRAMLSDNDVFGDTVNTAARVAHEAKSDEVLLSETLFTALPAALSFTSRSGGALELKGKAVPHPVVILDWRSGDLTPGPAPLVPAATARPSNPELRAVTPTPEVFVLELQLSPGGLKVAAIDGAADKGTVKAYAEVKVTLEELDALSGIFSTYMRGDGSDSYLPRIREQGKALFSSALSDRAQRHLEQTPQEFLRLHIDDDLVQIPWELMHDGREFVSLRFAMGRLVSARADTSPVARLPSEGARGHVLIVSNPSGDLPAAAREGQALDGLFREGFAGEVRHLAGPVKKADFLAALGGCRILHFAGHALADGAARGFQLADGSASPEEITEAVGRSAPALVFANSCSSSTGKGWAEAARGVSGLASSLLLRGATHYVAPMWDIPDEDALSFALRFYERALAGVPFGEAARHARQSLMERHQSPLSFAGYVLYGEPRTAFDPEAVKLKGAHKMRSAPVPGARPAAVDASRAPPFSPATPPRRTTLYAGLGAMIAAVGGLAFFASRTPARLVEPAITPAPVLVAKAPLAAASGPVRIAVLSFKNVSGDKALDAMRDGLAEAIVTDFGPLEGVKLIERGQIDVDINEIEFEQTKYVDPATRTVVGKIAGTELVVMGGFQQEQGKLRAFARLVKVETGEVLFSTKVDRPAGQILDLQDALAEDVSKRIHALKEKLTR